MGQTSSWEEVEQRLHQLARLVRAFRQELKGKGPFVQQLLQTLHYPASWSDAEDFLLYLQMLQTGFQLEEIARMKGIRPHSRRQRLLDLAARLGKGGGVQ